MVVIQVKPMYRKPEEGHGHTGRELDKDDTWRLLIEARSTVLHTEAGYTTDNLLLPSKLMPCNEGGDHIRPSRGWSSLSHGPTLVGDHFPGAAMKTLPEHLRFTTGHCRFGGLLLAVSDDGVAVILLGDEDAAMVADLQQRFPSTTLKQDSKDLEQD